MNETEFVSSFVREYLRYVQRDEATLTGMFEFEGNSIVWGAVAEYGPPPRDGLVIEFWAEQNEAADERSNWRFWMGRGNVNGKTVKGRIIMRDELKMEDGSVYFLH